MRLAAFEQSGFIYTSTNGGVTWTTQSALGTNTWETRGLASSGDGTRLAIVATLSLLGDIWTAKAGQAVPLSTNFRWTHPSTGMHIGLSITSSSDGTKLAAGDGSGDIWTSTNGGYSWKDRTSSGSHQYKSITSSSDGMKLAASDNYGSGSGGDIYTSTDGGATWTDRSSAGARNWNSITSSSDGTKLAAVDGNPGDIWTSTDSGATWTDRSSAGSRAWQSITSSSDGTKLAAGDCSPGDVWTSTDSGVTWTDRSSATNCWRSITSSSDGTKLAAVDGNSANVYTSADSGATWTTHLIAGTGTHWLWSITSSSDGTKLAVADTLGYIGYGIYTSKDSGATWTLQQAPGLHDWNTITSSSDGSKLAAVYNSGGDVWIGTVAKTTLAQANTTFMSNGLVGYWTFDGKTLNWKTGQVLDISGNNNTGQMIGMSTTTSPVPGKIGQALKFNGSSSCVTTGNIADNLSNMTVSAWIKTNTGSTGAIVSKIHDYFAGTGWALERSGWNQGDIGFFTQDNGGNSYNFFTTTATTWGDNKWHHVVATLSGGVAGTITIYIDGVSQPLTNHSSGTVVSDSNSNNVVIGGFDTALTAYFPGTIDDVRIYNRALGADEITQLYNAGR
jgi:photosystem II stability/assembly factor-like uncharacterized protein